MYLEKSKQPIIWNGKSICEVNAMEESIVRALMFFQVLINGLQHIVSANVRPKLQTVDTFIKVSRVN